MTFCGPKYSLCCTLLSVWGIVQLILMGIFFNIRSPALIEDLYIPDEAKWNADTFIQAMNDSYHQISINCFIAAGMYGGTLIISGWQFWLNSKNSS